MLALCLVLVGCSGDDADSGSAGSGSTNQASETQAGRSPGEDPPAPTPWSDPAVIAGIDRSTASKDEIRSGLASHNVRQDLMDDPSRDGWNTETLSSEAQRRLDAMMHAIFADTLQAEVLARALTDDFTAARLRPCNLSTAFERQNLRVSRSSELERCGDGVRKGAQGFLDSEILPSEVDPKTIHLKVKTWGVTLDGDQLSTRHYMTFFDDSGYEQNATWQARWKVDPSNGRLFLASLDGQDFEEVFADLPQGRIYGDATRSVLGNTQQFDAQIMPSVHQWLRGIDISVDPDFEGMQGVAIGDVNGDGLEDIYACQGGGLPNRLYLQNADGTVRDATAGSGADFIETTRSASLVDLDNDGDPDLVLGTDGLLVILENDGSGRFTERLRNDDITLGFSMAVADYDVDGDLDIYATRHFSESHRAVGQLPNPVPYHDANNGGRNVLLRNEGNWVFADVTQAVGLEENNRRWSYAAAWDDYDRDGDLDLYVANDFGRNNLYRNDGGRFRDVAAEAGVEDIASGMSASWGDVDGDGWSDIYVSNMFSAAGSRITYQRAFQGDANDETRAHYQRLARGNTLFRNLGDGTFEDISIEANVTMGRWSWGSTFVDINNDGLEDIVVGNGYITGDDTGDL